MFTTKEALDNLFNGEWINLSEDLKDQLYYLRTRYYQGKLSDRKKDSILIMVGYSLVSDKKWSKKG